MNERRRMLMGKAEEGGMIVVDLGLPSGTKWAACNVGASAPEELGLYFSWGNVVGYEHDNVWFPWNGYAEPGASLTTNIPTNDTYDAARLLLGAPWRMPTVDEASELINNCDRQSRYVLNGQVGFMFTSRINGKTLFLPYTGRARNNSISVPDHACYWTSTYSDETYAMAFGQGPSVPGVGLDQRLQGLCIRAVC